MQAQQAVLVVAVEGGCSDWAAYAHREKTPRGWLSDHTMQEFIDRVVEDGDKVSYDVARRLFPEWDARLAWRD